MADSITLSLSASLKTDPEKDSLPFLIARINEQRGSFRNITEDTLEDEIRAQEAGHTEAIEEAGGGEDVLNEKPRGEQLAIAREDMLRQVTQAYTESAQALDFVSLLISQHTPQQAEKTLNPYTKNALPLGVLGSDAVQLPQISDTQKNPDRLVSLGWKLQSLNSVADSLLSSATRLEQEIDRENRYWEKVLDVKQQGWSICRLPREKHTLGVKYGFSEAYVDFRDRGMAALRQDEGGDVSIDKGSRSTDRVLRVQIVHKGRTLSTSYLPESGSGDQEDEDEDMPIERQILQARNNIYDEELHSELHREARNLMNQGVRCVDDMIQLPYGADKQIEIDLIDCEVDQVTTSQDENSIATALAVALRILLSHAHRQNLHRRSQPPPPIMEGKRPRPVYPILKPVIENIRHRSDAQSVQAFLAGLTASLHRASLSFATKQAATSLNIPPRLSVSRKGEPPLTDTLLNALTSPLQTSIDLHLPSRQASLKIDIHTNLFPPILGTEFRTISSPGAQDSPLCSLPESMHFTCCDEIERHVLHVLVLDLVFVVVADDKTWEIVDPYTGSLSRQMRNKEGKFGSTSLRVYFEAGQLGLEWQRREEGEEELQRGQKRWTEGDVAKEDFMKVVHDLAVGSV